MHGAASQVVLAARAAIPVRCEEEAEARSSFHLRRRVAAQPSAATVPATAAVHAVCILDFVREVALCCRAVTSNSNKQFNSVAREEAAIT